MSQGYRQTWDCTFDLGCSQTVRALSGCRSHIFWVGWAVSR